MKAALFDVGDTLIHKWVHKRDRFVWLCEQAGLQVPADPLLRLRAARAAERFFQDRQRRPDRDTLPWWIEHNSIGLRQLGLSVEHAASVYHVSGQIPHSQYLDPEAVPLLRSLRDRGWRIGLVSNWDGTLEAQVAETGLAPYIDFVGDSQVFGARKPDPAFFRHVLNQLGVQPEHAFHVGDSYGADVVGARSAGVRPVLLDALNCEERPCDHRVTTLSEVLERCASW